MRDWVYGIYCRWWFRRRVQRYASRDFQRLPDSSPEGNRIGILALGSRLTSDMDAAWFARQLHVSEQDISLLIVDPGSNHVNSLSERSLELWLKNKVQVPELDDFKANKLKYLFHIYPPDFWSLFYLGLSTKASEHIAFWSPDQGPGTLFLPMQDLVITESLLKTWHQLEPHIEWN